MSLDRGYVLDLGSQMKQSDFGRLVGISQPAVSGLISRGVLEEGASGSMWLLAYCRHLRETAAGRASSGDHDLATERARLAHHNANLASMEERKRSGELCETSAVVLTLTRIGVDFRTALERMADTLADRVAAETDPHACHQLLSAKVQETLAQLANDCEAAALEVVKHGRAQQ